MFKTALEVLSSKLGNLFSIKAEKDRLKGELLLSLHQYELAVEEYKKILISSPDDWESILRVIDGSLEVSSVKFSHFSFERASEDAKVSSAVVPELPSHLSKDEVAGKLEVIRRFFKELQVDDTKDIKRGPFLGLLEIEIRIRLCKLVEQNEVNGKENLSTSLADFLLEYFERFGHLPSFLPETKRFLIYLEDFERHRVAETLHESCLHSLAEPPTQLLRRKITAFQVEEQLGLFATISDRGLLVQVSRIIKLYLECVKISSDLDPQECMHGEELLIITSNLLIELFRRSKKLGFLLEALLILEFGLLLQRFNFSYKLMLINLYSLLGAIVPAFDWFKALDVKNILLETLSHHIMPTLLGSLHWLDLENLLKEVMKFHEDYRKEAADFSILAYQHCNYSKVLELVDLKQKLERSHNYTVARIEAANLSLKQKLDKPDDVEALLSNMGNGIKLLQLSTDDKLLSLCFNEDLDSRPWWSPAPDESFLEGSCTSSRDSVPSFKDVQDLEEKRHQRWCFSVKRRSMIPRLIFLVIKLSSSPSIEREKGNLDNVRDLIIELRVLLESYAETLGISWNSVNEVLNELSSSRKTFQEMGLESVTLATLAVFYYAYQVSSQLIEPPSEHLMDFIHVDKIIKACIEEFSVEVNLHLHEVANSLAPGNAISSLCRLTSEVLGSMGLFLQVWVKRLQSFSRKMKKSGTTFEQTDQASDTRLLNNLRTVTQSLCDELEVLTSSLGLRVEVSIEQEAELLLSSCLRAQRQLRHDLSDSDVAPGSVLEMLETYIDNREILSSQNGQALQLWKPNLLLQKIVNSQHSVFIGIKDIIGAQLKLFKTIKF